MPKYWGKQIFRLRSFPEVGQKQKTEKKERILQGLGVAAGCHFIYDFLWIARKQRDF